MTLPCEYIIFVIFVFRNCLQHIKTQKIFYLHFQLNITTCENNKTTQNIHLKQKMEANAWCDIAETIFPGSMGHIPWNDDAAGQHQLLMLIM